MRVLSVGLRLSRWILIPLTLFMGACGGGSGNGGMPTGTIQGVVRDAATSQPITHAIVSIQGAALQDATDDQGRYTVSEVPVGQQTVMVTAAGYQSQSQEVEVAANQTATADFALTAVPAGGRMLYVSPTGDNAHAGTQQAPWATPGYASRQLRPGDTLIILGGRYRLSEFDADIITPPSGREDAWITIRGETGNRPVLAAGDNLITAVALSGAHYVRLENLEITHDDQAHGQAAYFRDGIQIMDQPASHLVLKDLYIHHLDEFGLNFQDVEEVQILNCRIEYAGFGAIGGPAAQRNGWSNVLIQNCRLSYSGHYYQGGDGTNRPYDRPDGFGIEPSQGPVEIVETVAEHNYGDGLDSKAARTTIRRCIVANNSCDGVKLWGDQSRVENTLIYGRGDGNPDPTPWSPLVIHTEQAQARFEVLHVTVDDTLGGNYLMHVQYDTPDVPLQVTVRNSIFRGIGPNSPLFVGRATNLTADHNLFYLPDTELVLDRGNLTYTAGNLAELGEGNRYGDPRFVAPAWGAQGDYHLQAGSPALDSGTAAGAPSTDLEGNPRPRGSGYDLGAYESQS